MNSWDMIMDEAERLAGSLLSFDVDLSEAQKVGDYFVAKGCDREVVLKYLREMSKNPPPRSRRTQPYYQKLLQIWQGWRSQLPAQDQARAWGWGARVAKTRRWILGR